LTLCFIVAKMYLPGSGTADARSASTALAGIHERTVKMAPLPPSNTPRFRFHYTVIGRQHTLQLRSPSSPSGIAGFVNAYFTAFGVDLFATILDFADWAPAGSDIFNPVTTGLEGHTYGSGVGNLENTPWAYTFIGRTPGGRRVRLNQYGAKSLSANYRFTAGEQATVDAVIALLNIPGSQLRGIDNTIPIWKTYANAQVNDHWIKRVRP
jgi:hypothetical protein